MEEGKTLHSECNDFHLLTDENFDFDLSLSPTSESEDEVFIGPMGHKEKCIAASLAAYEKSETTTIPSLLDDLAWSPPAGDKFVEIFKEANLLALQLTSGSKKKRRNKVRSGEQNAEAVEKFVKESKSKLKILEKGIAANKTPTAIRRETYCIWDSPACQSMPSILKRSEQPVRTSSSPCPQMLLNMSTPDKTNELAEAPAAHLAHVKSDTHLNKTSTFRTVQKPSVGNYRYLAVGQPKPGKLPSPSNRTYATNMGSSEDLLSDKSSTASDAGDSSSCANSSVQSKKTLPTPSKLGLKTRQLKPPSNVQMQRNTSSSSSSVSSMNSSLNSSLPISPKRGNAKTNVSKAPASLSRLSSGANKISVVKPMRRFSVYAPHSDASGKHPTPRCAKEKPSENRHGLKANLPLETSSNGIQEQGSNPGLQKLQRHILGDTNASSSPKPKPKMAPRVLKGGAFSENEPPRVLKSDRVLSFSTAGSNTVVTPPANQLQEGSVLKPGSTIKPALRTPKIRHSTLPTPIGRRLSGIPTLTPQTVPRAMASPNFPALRQTSSVSSKKTSANRNFHLLCLPNSKCVNEKKKTWVSSSSSSAEGDFSSPRVVPIALDFSPEKTFKEIEQDVIKKGKPAEEIPAKENLLIEFEIDKTPVAIHECENKPLIDLFNTPEIIKAPILKPAGQLIDLSSPLMKLSPEGNKENLDSPLLKF